MSGAQRAMAGFQGQMRSGGPGRSIPLDELALEGAHPQGLISPLTTEAAWYGSDQLNSAGSSTPPVEYAVMVMT